MSFEKSYYESSHFWEGSALTDPSNMERFGLTASLVPADVRTLLDAGCGNGVFGRYLGETRPEITVTGMDRSQEALRHVTTGRLEGSVSAIPAEDRSYDCVTCLEVLEHLPIQDYSQALHELARVARRHIVVGVPYREKTERNTTTCPECRTTFNAYLHLRRFDDDTLKVLLDSVGFHSTELAFPSPTRAAVGAASLSRLRTHIADLRDRRPFASPVSPPLYAWFVQDRPTLEPEIA